MALKISQMPLALIREFRDAASGEQSVQYGDTDPQMTHAMYEMELGVDPDESLDRVAGAVVTYDKFRAGISRRR
ncbi:hypothetical protein BH09SUM1_BH09SUM1_30530 [soil metagenome]